MKPLRIFTLVFVCCAMIFSVHAEDSSSTEVRIEVRGVAVQHPSSYQVKTPTTIEQAFALAGGWTGLGENGTPANFFVLTQNASGTPVRTRIHIHIDRKTRQIQVRDPVWKDYQLKDGDIITLPIVFY